MNIGFIAEKYSRVRDDLFSVSSQKSQTPKLTRTDHGKLGRKISTPRRKKAHSKRRSRSIEKRWQEGAV